MSRDIFQAVRDACLWLPEAEEFVSHGFPHFRVRGKTFASYVVNHHGDGRIALWLNAKADMQESCVRFDPEQFFVPPYVGPRGWLGVHLDKGLAWQRIATLIRNAYEKVAPRVLIETLGETPAIAEPTIQPAASAFDSLRSARGEALLATLRAICLRFPEAREAMQYGSPVWRAGTRTFAWARSHEQRLTVCFWVGVDRQQLLTADTRFRIPPYLGHNGWIEMDATTGCDPDEIAQMALESYRHFALKRMLQRLSPG